MTTHPGADTADADRTRLVDRLLSTMTVEAMVGQLMCVYHTHPDATTLARTLEASGIEPGGVLIMSRSTEQARRDVAFLQEWSEVPLLVAANLEAGTAGFLTDGETFANPMQIAATRDPLHARRLGEFCAAKARDLGLNWAFAPVVDIAINPANPITGTRTFGSDAELVAELAVAYVTSLQHGGVAAAVKHWPGDGVDGRDQHLLTSINGLDLAAWRDSFGEVYRRTFEVGVASVMAAHIALPAYRPDDDDGLLPASLRPALLRDLLRGELGFDGLVVSDNTLMAGFTRVLDRPSAIARAVSAGCDMLLGSQFTADDYASLLTAAHTGHLTEERLRQAAGRVLRMKSNLGLLGESSNTAKRTVVDRAGEFASWKRDVARESITLVRTRPGVLPVTGDRYSHVVVYVLGDAPTFYEPSSPLAPAFVDALVASGVTVDVRMVPAQGRTVLTEHEAQSRAEVIVYFANLSFTSDSNTNRIKWSYPQAPEVPRRADKPVILVSVADPYHAQDIPSADIIINGYCPSPHTLDALIDALVHEAPSTAVSPIDPFCGNDDTTADFA